MIQPQVLTVLGLKYALHMTLCCLAPSTIISLLKLLSSLHLLKHVSWQLVSLTIYTDSRYAFGVVHDFGALWKHRHFLESDGKLILNSSQVSNLLDVLLSTEISVCKCAAHTNSGNTVACGNAIADAATLFPVLTSLSLQV